MQGYRLNYNEIPKGDLTKLWQKENVCVQQSLGWVIVLRRWFKASNFIKMHRMMLLSPD